MPWFLADIAFSARTLRKDTEALWKKLKPDSSFHKLVDLQKLGENVKLVPALVSRLNELTSAPTLNPESNVDYTLGVAFFLGTAASTS